MKRNNKKGFTIVELVIVIAVIAILAGVLIPTFAGITNRAKESAALQEATNALKAYVADYAATDEKVDLYIAKLTKEGDKFEIAFEVKAGQIGNKKMESVPQYVADNDTTTDVNEEKAGDYAFVTEYEGGWKVYTKG